MKHEITFARACEQLQMLLDGVARRELANALSREKNLRASLMRLRDVLRSHSFVARDTRIDLEPFVRAYDRRTRREGFHVLNDWDGKADRVNDDIIPIDVL